MSGFSALDAHEAQGASCPDENILAAYVSGRLSAAEIDTLERHLDGCENCLDVTAAAAKAEPTPADRGGAR